MSDHNLQPIPENQDFIDNMVTSYNTNFDFEDYFYDCCCNIDCVNDYEDEFYCDLENNTEDEYQDIKGELCQWAVKYGRERS